jgi:hypothetical protein
VNLTNEELLTLELKYRFDIYGDGIIPSIPKHPALE